MIGEEDGFGIVGADNTFRGPGTDIYTMSTRDEGYRVGVLRVQRRHSAWRREIRIIPNNNWWESTNGGPVERSSAYFWQEQDGIVRRLFCDIRQGVKKDES